MLRSVVTAVAVALSASLAAASESGTLPIFDVHVHYSHDSVALTPPDKVIELMREAGLARALVSSSDARGTRALLERAPNLIVPGLRPYRRRGETGSWVRDPEALAYVETLLAEHRWASLGEFHLYGEDADLPIPRRAAQLAVAHNLVLHAHSDDEAVRRLLAQQPRARVLWAHAGFAAPDLVTQMLAAHPTLYADLAFRSDIARAGVLDPQWRAVFERFPDRLMLGTDTYTPERMYYVPEHARESRQWLAGLPGELAERLAWRNAEALLVARWENNRSARALCGADDDGASHIRDADVALAWRAVEPIVVGEPFAIDVRVCGDGVSAVTVDADMPAHRHGMNYRPAAKPATVAAQRLDQRIEGLLWHMPGQWRLTFAVERDGKPVELTEQVSVP